MQSIYKNRWVREKFHVTFSYLFFKDYKNGLERDNKGYEGPLKIDPLPLLSIGNLFNQINLILRNRPLRRLIKLPFYLLQRFGFFVPWNYLVFVFYLRREDPDVVHINNGGYPAAETCNQLARVLLFFPRIRVIYQVNNQAIYSKSIYSRFFDWVINSSVDVFLTHSKQNRERLLKRGFPIDKLRTFPSFFKETIQGSSEYRDKDKFTLCVVGFLSYRKGQMFLLEVFVSIRESHPEVFENMLLNLVGNGEEEFQLKEYVEKNNLQDHVAFLGQRSDYISFINNCDLYMLTSIEGEDLPLVLITAMERGKCIIASNFAGISDVLTHGKDAYLIEPIKQTFILDIKEAVLKLHADKKLREDFSKNVRDTFNNTFGEEIYAARLLELYDNN
jgi:glycosyltransferase involved in cell wall biosynthesis